MNVETRQLVAPVVVDVSSIKARSHARGKEDGGSI